MGNMFERLNVSRQSNSMRYYVITHGIMEQQEKFAITCKTPLYNAIPLDILDEANGKSYNVETDKLKYSNPSGMLLRLLLFWIFWAILIVTLIITIVAYFCMEPRLCLTSNRHRYVNITNCK